MEKETEEAVKTEEKEEETAESTEEKELKEEELEKALEETPEEEAKAEGKEEQKEEELPLAEEKEEAKPPKEEKEKEEEEIVEERVYTVPLGKAWIQPPNKRTPRAVRMLRSFIIKHMKLEAKKETETGEEEEPSKLIISNEVNERMWARGVEKPPRKIRVRAAKDKEGNVTLHLAEGD